MNGQTLVERLHSRFLNATTHPAEPPRMSRRTRLWIGLKTMGCFWLVIHEAGMYAVEAQQHDWWGMVLRAVMGGLFLWVGVQGVVRIERSVIGHGRTSITQDKP